jgi:hypothetical protein
VPLFEVLITEPPAVVDAHVSPGGASSAVQPFYWRGTAADESAAEESAWEAWDEKFGSGKRPVSAVVKVTKLDG